MPVIAARTPLSKIVGLAAGCLLLIAPTASAQYTVQVVMPPADFPMTANTRSYAINGSGQVLGIVFAPGFETRLVLWTNGVPQYLTLPDGYSLSSSPGYQFLNDAGRAVLSLVPNAGPVYASRAVYWDDPASPQFVPLAPNTCGVAGDPVEFPWGLNNLGHILISDSTCGNLWRWNGGDALDFHDQVSFFTPIGGGLCANNYRMYANRSHLNDADHVAIEFGSYNGNCPTFTRTTGILTGTSFTPIGGVPPDGGVFNFNNDDQLLTGDANDAMFWDGSAIAVHFGPSTYPSLNDLGQVNFWDHGVPKIYENGTVTDLVLPPVPLAFSTGGASIINNVGQLLSSSLIQYSGPFGPLSEQAVLFTPRKPVITWPKPADITYGTALGLGQLNATANVPGTFTYNPPAGTVLSAAAIQLLSVTFTPDNPVLYDPTTASNSIGVLPAPLTVKADDTSKEFGAPLPAFSATFIGLVNGDGPGSLLGALALTTTATSASPAGPYPIVPSGVSSPNYIMSFVAGTLTVAQASTTTTLQVLPGTTGYLQANALIAHVARTNPGLGSPGGLVRFRDGTTVIGSAGVSGGQAFVLANGLTPGTHSLTAEYLGTANFAASSAAPGTATIRPIANSTFTTLTISTNPQALGTPARLTARVNPLAGGTPTGTVQFFEGSTVLGNASVVAGVATLNTTAIGAGTHLVRAKYFGNATFAPSTSPPALITIYTVARPGATAVALAGSPSPATLGQPLTFTATVTGGATTGTVYFYADGLFVGAGSLANIGGSFKATLTLTTGALSAGRHVLAAVYLGSAGFAGSTSPIVTLTIQTASALSNTEDETAPLEEVSTPTPQ